MASKNVALTTSKKVTVSNIEFVNIYTIVLAGNLEVPNMLYIYVIVVEARDYCE